MASRSSSTSGSFSKESSSRAGIQPKRKKSAMKMTAPGFFLHFIIGKIHLPP
jgi:hypothetical protein